MSAIFSATFCAVRPLIPTSMSQDIRLKGQLAAKTIIENIDNSNNSFSMVNLGAKLVERDTVKKLN